MFGACTGRGVRGQKKVREPVEGTIKDFVGFDAQEDCKVLNEAMEGSGKDKTTQNKIIGILGLRSNKQRQALKVQYAQMYETDLIEALKSELGGKFEDAILALFQKADEFDAWCLHDAMSGVGTNENTIIEIMCSRSNEEIKSIIAAYKRVYKKDLVKDLESETSDNFQKLLSALAQASRLEGYSSSFALLNRRRARRDAQALFNAGEGKQGSRQAVESQFHAVFATKSFEHLELVSKQYERIEKKKTFEEAIKSKLTGDLETAMLAIVKCAKDKITYFAECLYECLEGTGTDDKTLIRLMVSRSEVDLVQIKSTFETKYSKSLEMLIEADYKKRSGDYKKVMLQICRGN